MIVQPGDTNVQVEFVAKDASNNPLPLAFDTPGLVAEYRHGGDTDWTAITLVEGTLGTWISGGLAYAGEGNVQLGLPNAALIVGIGGPSLFGGGGNLYTMVRLRGVTGMQCPPIRIDFLGIPNIRAGAADLLAGGGLATFFEGPGGEHILGAAVNLTTSTYNGLVQFLGLAIGRYFAAIARSDAAATTDFSSELAAINTDGGSGAGSFDNVQHSLQAQASGGGAEVIADAVLDGVVDNGLTMRQVLMVVGAVLGGKSSGAGGASEILKAIGGEQARMTVGYDTAGNRTTVTFSFV